MSGQDGLLLWLLLGLLYEVVPLFIVVDGALLPHGRLSFLEHAPLVLLLLPLFLVLLVVGHHYLKLLLPHFQRHGGSVAF